MAETEGRILRHARHRKPRPQSRLRPPRPRRRSRHAIPHRHARSPRRRARISRPAFPRAQKFAGHRDARLPIRKHLKWGFSDRSASRLRKCLAGRRRFRSRFQTRSIGGRIRHNANPASGHTQLRQHSPQPNNSSAASHSPQKNPHSTAQFSKLPTFLTFLIQRKPAADAPHLRSFTRLRPRPAQIKPHPKQHRRRHTENEFHFKLNFARAVPGGTNESTIPASTTANPVRPQSIRRLSAGDQHFAFASLAIGGSRA